jgi:anthranilate phosphoribosyltransferase
VLEGEGGPQRDVSLLNAGAAIYVAGGAKDVEEGVARATKAVDSGAAFDVLSRLVARSRELSGAS